MSGKVNARTCRYSSIIYGMYISTISLGCLVSLNSRSNVTVGSSLFFLAAHEPPKTPRCVNVRMCVGVSLCGWVGNEEEGGDGWEGWEERGRWGGDEWGCVNVMLYCFPVDQ